MTQGSGGAPPPLNVYYMQMASDQVHSRLGKLRAGQVVAVPGDLAARMLVAGAAKQVSSSEFEEQAHRQQERVSARQELFANLNRMGALGDVSQYRDVLTAPEAGLRQAYDAGLPLANLGMLFDEEGNPLAQDADIEEILEARKNLHTDKRFPYEAHERSSVMGGGSPFTQVVSRGETPAGSAASPPPPPSGGRAGRAQRRATTLHGNQAPPAGSNGEPPPPPPPTLQTPSEPE